jgi:hypothetical protein
VFLYVYLLFLWCFIYLLDLQDIYWIQKLIIIYVNWFKYPGLKKKKKAK